MLTQINSWMNYNNSTIVNMSHSSSFSCHSCLLFLYLYKTQKNAKKAKKACLCCIGIVVTPLSHDPFYWPAHFWTMYVFHFNFCHNVTSPLRLIGTPLENLQNSFHYAVVFLKKHISIPGWSLKSKQHATLPNTTTQCESKENAYAFVCCIFTS